MGDAVRVGNVWTRQFLHATSILDLDSPLASSVCFQGNPCFNLSTQNSMTAQTSTPAPVSAPQMPFSVRMSLHFATVPVSYFNATVLAALQSSLAAAAGVSPVRASHLPNRSFWCLPYDRTATFIEP